jgi:hypothetical protein
MSAVVETPDEAPLVLDQPDTLISIESSPSLSPRLIEIALL